MDHVMLTRRSLDRARARERPDQSGGRGQVKRCVKVAIGRMPTGSWGLFIISFERMATAAIALSRAQPPVSAKFCADVALDA
jgi:hypothetical protein